ncbi:DUF3050 domain-containing protein [Telluribacter sp. SYSU D00476]|uniref:DUF3050 domain-containing protein n=1 Tax=Telluribacter sp. SYSU D00476 TaxID=2811430 RepID=UPI001FF217E1|nr:DUF3050 domain-containing protein [Telluribacter sp. SYSU D00476]
MSHTSPRIQRLRDDIEPLRQQLVSHPVYDHIRSLDDLRVFMEIHVFAVWDYMSLLKALQRALTCVTLPWMPSGAPHLRYHINKIVLEEESNIDPEGRHLSHFELYLEAMKLAGANTSRIQSLLDNLRSGASLTEALEQTNTPAKEFVLHTFDIIENSVVPVQAAVFTFGREDLIPDMYLSIVRKLSESFPEQVGMFQFYLERFMEIGVDHHSHLAYQMTEELCLDDDTLWHKATEAVKTSLTNRLHLWDAVMLAITTRKEEYLA